MHKQHVIASVSSNVIVNQRNKQGTLQFHTHNLVVDSGLNLLRDAITGGSAHLTHIGFGSGTTAADAADVGLETEITSLRQSLTSSEASDGQLVLGAYLSESDGVGETISELGLFTSDTDGDMYARAVLDPAIAKESGDAISIVWTLDWSSD